MIQDLNAPTDPGFDTTKTLQDGDFFVLDPDSTVDDNEQVFQFDTGSVINFFAGGDVLNDATVITINDGVNSKAFEFEDATAATPDGLSDPTAQQIDFGPGTNATALVAALVAAITADNTTTIVATAVGNRSP